MMTLITKKPQYLVDKKSFSCVAGIGFEPITFPKQNAVSLKLYLLAVL